MSFTDLLAEWLALREQQRAPAAGLAPGAPGQDSGSFNAGVRDQARMQELADAMDRIVRGELLL
jgi:hypothetical protein